MRVVQGKGRKDRYKRFSPPVAREIRLPGGSRPIMVIPVTGKTRLAAFQTPPTPLPGRIALAECQIAWHSWAPGTVCTILWRLAFPPGMQRSCDMALFPRPPYLARHPGTALLGAQSAGFGRSARIKTPSTRATSPPQGGDLRKAATRPRCCGRAAYPHGNAAFLAPLVNLLASRLPHSGTRVTVSRAHCEREHFVTFLPQRPGPPARAATARVVEKQSVGSLPLPYSSRFTLPHALNGIIAQEPNLAYPLLFPSHDTLLEFAARTGVQPASRLFSHLSRLSRSYIFTLVTVEGSVDGWIRPCSLLFPVRALPTMFAK